MTLEDAKRVLANFAYYESEFNRLNEIFEKDKKGSIKLSLGLSSKENLLQKEFRLLGVLLSRLKNLEQFDLSYPEKRLIEITIEESAAYLEPNKIGCVNKNPTNVFDRALKIIMKRRLSNASIT